MKVNPDAAGLDADRLERITEHLSTRYVEPGKIAGCQTLVARHGSVGYFSSLGVADLEQQTPVADDTIWRIYSMTKPIAGVALMSLFEQGHFQLNDPIHRFIPSWRGLKVQETKPDGSTHLVDPVRPPTVRDAMMHMAGLGWGDEGPLTMDRFMPAMAKARGGREGTLATMAEHMSQQPLAAQPGTAFIYGLSTDICGHLVEIMSGQSFDEYLQATIFDPLGMPDTSFHVTDDQVERLATNYARLPNKSLAVFDSAEKSTYRKKPKFLSGGGGLVSTTADYYRFTQMLLNGGELDGQRILGRKTVELMAMNHLPDGADLAQFTLPGGYGETGFDGVGFGLTMANTIDPTVSQAAGSAGDFYWGGAASTAFWIDPVEDLTVVFMTQLMPSGTFNFRGQLRSLVYSAIID